MKLGLHLTKTLLVLGAFSAFAVCSFADTITLNSSASETTNNSGSATINIAKNPGWADPIAGSSWVSYGQTGDPSSEGYFASANGTVVTFYDRFFVGGTPTSGTVNVLADDSTSVVLQGVTLFNEASTSGNGYHTCSDFTIGCLAVTEGHIDLTSALSSGWNTLAFSVGQRAGSSFGLDYSGTVDYTAASATPEPGSILLLGTGLALMGLGAFRRMRSKAPQA